MPQVYGLRLLDLLEEHPQGQYQEEDSQAVPLGDVHYLKLEFPLLLTIHQLIQDHHCHLKLLDV